MPRSAGTPLLILLASFCLISEIAFAQGVVVGNGGRGVRKSPSTVLLSDLVEYGNSETAWIGQERGAPRSETYYSTLPPETPRDLLERKLTDLDRISLGLGASMASLIPHYNWQLVPGPLERTRDDEDVILKHSTGEFVQIANRLDNTIRIDRDLWLQMPKEHQVALLIHELVYGLFKPACETESHCLVPAPRVRELVGLFFSERSLVMPIPHLNQQLGQLAVPLGYPYQLRKRSFFISFEAKSPAGVPYRIGDVELRTSAVDFPGSRLAQVCQNYFSLRTQGSPSSVAIKTMTLESSYNVQFFDYPTKWGRQKQARVALNPMDSNPIAEKIPSTLDECLGFLSSQYLLASEVSRKPSDKKPRTEKLGFWSTNQNPFFVNWPSAHLVVNESWASRPAPCAPVIRNFDRFLSRHESVQWMFCHFADRAPTAAEFLTWGRESAPSMRQLIWSYLSKEAAYRNLLSRDKPVDRLFLQRLYSLFFKRAPESSGLDYWLSISKRVNRREVIHSFLHSYEFSLFMPEMNDAWKKRQSLTSR